MSIPEAEQFFKKCNGLELEPNMNYIKGLNPTNHIAIIYYVMAQVPNQPTAESAILICGSFGRYRPNSIYAHIDEQTKEVSISNTQPISVDPKSLYSGNTLVMKCGNSKCHKIDCEEYGLNVQLSACSRCKLIKYCSKECQTQDWKKHKSICNSITNK